MSDLRARIAIFGSGELAPSMVKVHRNLLESLGSALPVFIDSTFGFQENADELTAKAKDYFRDHYKTNLSVASLRGEVDVNPANLARYRAALEKSNYIFAGPGSPSYALKMFHLADLGNLLTPRLRDSIVLCFASAASTTLGEFALPVYEIYKAGHDPSWLEGINLFSSLGLRIAIVPHYDNHEGATHDTRFCYIGERRLKILEEMLPNDAAILGVDEHTAAIVDTESGKVSVLGRAAVTLRHRGKETTFRTGESFRLDDLMAAETPATSSKRSPSITTVPDRSEPLALNGDPRATVDMLLGLVDEGDMGKLTRSLVELEEPLAQGPRQLSEIINPLMALLIELRDEARAAKDFALSDRIRDRLTERGFVIFDTPEGSQWKLESTP